MAKFLYSVSDLNGARSSGHLVASSLEEAKDKLKKDYPIIISVNEEKNTRIFFWQKPSLGTQDKMMFAKHMGTMLKVGITISEALKILIDQTKETNNRKMYENILDRINSGQSLSNSLREYDYVFPEIFINMIATGEESGNLEQTLKYLDAQMEKEYELKKKVMSAFIYPAVIIGITVLMTMGIIIFIMPKILAIFETFKVDLPLITELLIDFTNFITKKTLTAVALFGGILAFFIFIFKVKILKPFWHRVAIHLPIFGKIIIHSNVARFSRTLHSLLQSGIPITEALQITANMVGNTTYRKIILTVKEKVEQGGKIGESFLGYEKFFPDLATKMLGIGERTGSLDTTSENVAELYEQSVDSMTKNLSVLLEPLLLVFMSAMVGGIALAIILPIYQLPNLLQK